MDVLEKISPKISNAIKEQLQMNAEPESQVVLHITFSNHQENMLIRIWPTTFLFAKHSSHQSDLLFVDNITLHPMWTEVAANKKHTFTLVFSGLPKSCKFFDMIEDIPQKGGFSFLNIERNKTDVYWLMME
jgi:hypothetical protein